MSTETHVEKLVHLSKAKSFLGSEFLTWLWHLSETNSNQLFVKDSEGQSHEASIWVDDRVSLESTTSIAHSQTLRGGEPSKSAEAAAALESGKSVKELKLGLSIMDVGDFIATLDATSLSPRSLTLPVLLDDKITEDRASSVEARLEQTQLYLDAIDDLFATFLEQRVESKWESEKVSDLREWIKERSNNSIH